MDTATRAKDTAGQRKREAEIARHNASNALSDAMQANSEAENALDTSMEFKVHWFSCLPLPSKNALLQSEKCSARSKSSKLEEFLSVLFFAKTKVITPNQSNSKQIHVAGDKRRKMRASKP